MAETTNDLATRVAEAVAAVLMPTSTPRRSPRIVDIVPIELDELGTAIKIWVEGNCVHILTKRRHVVVCGSVEVSPVSAA